MEVRSAPEFGATDPLRDRLMRGWSASGVPVTDDRVFGLTAVTQSLRLAAGMVAGLRPIIYDATEGLQNKVEAVNSWQWKLFDRPSPGVTKFDMFSDISACVDGHGNAYVEKVKGGYGRGKAKRVLELRVLPPDKCRAYRDQKTGEKLFAVKGKKGKWIENIGPDQIIHIRGFTTEADIMGNSLIEQFKMALGNALGIQDFAGRYFANDASPGGYIGLPADTNLDKSQLDEILEIWEERHGGIQGKHRPAILQGGAEWKSTVVNAADAQMISAQQWSIEDISRMTDMEVELLTPQQTQRLPTEELINKTISVHIKPRAERIKAALNEDQDLFYDSQIFVDYDYSKTRTADLQAQSDHDLKMRQGGILTANEIRATQGYGPHPDGDILQMTPVGGEGNPNLEGDGKGSSGKDAGAQDKNESA